MSVAASFQLTYNLPSTFFSLLSLIPCLYPLAGTIYGPFDIEGHLGHDNVMYLCDLARLFPPEAPLAERPDVRPSGKGGMMVHLLRADFVRHNKVPLCSDTFFSICKATDDKCAEHVREVTDATKRLYINLIPRFVQTLIELHQQKGFVSDVTLLLHAFGLNVRHLGSVRKRASGHALIQQELLEEMLARTLPSCCHCTECLWCLLLYYLLLIFM